MRALDGQQPYRLGYVSSLAVLIGCCGAGAALLLTALISLITNICFYHRFSFAGVSATTHIIGHWVFLPPMIGALIIGLMARFVSEAVRGDGIPEAMETIVRNRARIQPKIAFWKPLSSAISIGTGGPFGAEGPIIQT